jgi:hypothetical protein
MRHFFELQKAKSKQQKEISESGSAGAVFVFRPLTAKSGRSSLQISA